MTFAAKYDGVCAYWCGTPIRVGDQITYDDGEIVHAGCVPTFYKPTDICPRCFMAKAANGTCDCTPAAAARGEGQ